MTLERSGIGREDMRFQSDEKGRRLLVCVYPPGCVAVTDQQPFTVDLHQFVVMDVPEDFPIFPDR